MDNKGPAKFVDVSHTIEHGMITYKGLPAPIICDYISREASRQYYAEGTEFQVDQYGGKYRHILCRKSQYNSRITRARQGPIDLDEN